MKGETFKHMGLGHTTLAGKTPKLEIGERPESEEKQRGGEKGDHLL